MLSILHVEQNILEDYVRAEPLYDDVYTFTIRVPGGFGEIGAVILHHDMGNEMYAKEIKLEGFPDGSSITIHCNSWVQPGSIRRIFFTNKVGFLYIIHTT